MTDVAVADGEATAAAPASVTASPAKKKPTAGKRKAAAAAIDDLTAEEGAAVAAAKVESAAEPAAATDATGDVEMKEQPAAAAAAPASPVKCSPAVSAAPSPAKPSSAKASPASKKGAAAAADEDDEDDGPKKPAAKKRRVIAAVDDDEDDGEPTAAASEPAAASPKSPANASNGKAAAKAAPKAAKAAPKAAAASKAAAAEKSAAAEKAPAAAAAAANAEEDEDDEELDNWTAHDALAAAEAALSSASNDDVPTFDAVNGGVWAKKGGKPAWKRGEHVPYFALAELFSRLENETSRLLNVGWMADFFRAVIALTPAELVDVVYLCTNTIAPSYDNTETNVGEGMLIKALAQATGGKQVELSRQFKNEHGGDMGELALARRAKQSTLCAGKALSCVDVLAQFRLLARRSGDSKISVINQLLVRAKGEEAKFIARALHGKLNIHMAEKGVLAALARAVTLTPPSLDPATPPPVLDLRKTAAGRDKDKLAAELERTAALINQAYTEVPNHDRVLGALLQHGVDSLPEHCFLTPGVPVKVMLGKPATSILELLQRFQGMKLTMEYKYDGERAQIHLTKDGVMAIYSRNSEDHTPKYPEVIQRMPSAVHAKQAKLVPKPTAESVAAAKKKAAQPTLGGTASKTSFFGAAAVAPPPAPVSPAASPSPSPTAEESKESPAAAAAASSSSLSTAHLPVVDEFIIDCEVVAWDRREQKILPFQTLSTRKKKDVNAEDVTVQVCLFAFDLLFINGKSYLEESLETRRQVLREHFQVVENEFYFASHQDIDVAAPTADGNEPDHSAMEESIQFFMNEAVQASCEGLMVKSLSTNATYIPNKRNWVKLKKDYLAGVGDTLDLVVIGAWQGKGKRQGVYGAFLLATYDAESEEFQSICKVGTGLSDAFLEESARYFSQHVLERPPRDYKYVESDVPDVWLEATRIWEIKCADLSLSPHHKAAIGRVHDSKGIALRFPRFVRERVGMDEKVVPDGITDAEQVTDMFNAQAVHGGQNANAMPKSRR